MLKKLKTQIEHFIPVIVVVIIIEFFPQYFNLDFMNPIQNSMDNFNLTDMVFSSLRDQHKIQKDTNIVIVNIGTLNRSGIARELEIINSYEPKVIGIDSFFKKMDETDADIVVGNRMMDTASMPAARKITNRIMSRVISKMCGQTIPDTQCGFKLIKRNVLESVKFEFSNFEIESEILLKAAKKGFKIESVPVKTVYRDETSKIKPVLDTLRFFAFIIRMWLTR